MIARLRGRIAGRAGPGLIIDVNGVGYLVHATPSVQRLGDGEITVETHTVVREDALQLYGFATAEERELFELLLGVSGVGPKVALAILSGSTPAELRRAIVREDGGGRRRDPAAYPVRSSGSHATSSSCSDSSASRSGF